MGCLKFKKSIEENFFFQSSVTIPEVPGLDITSRAKVQAVVSDSEMKKTHEKCSRQRKTLRQVINFSLEENENKLKLILANSDDIPDTRSNSKDRTTGRQNDKTTE